MERNWRKMLWS